MTLGHCALCHRMANVAAGKLGPHRATTTAPWCAGAGQAPARLHVAEGPPVGFIDFTRPDFGGRKR